MSDQNYKLLVLIVHFLYMGMFILAVVKAAPLYIFICWTIAFLASAWMISAAAERHYWEVMEKYRRSKKENG